jgi:hypothetical protein
MKRAVCSLAIVAAVLSALAAFVLLRNPPRGPLLQAAFLHYTNTAAGALAACIEVRNPSEWRIARNGCRITPEPGYWYLADVRSRVLEPHASETLVLVFDQQPMSRWQATAIYVRDCTPLEMRLEHAAGWLADHRLAPKALLQSRERRREGQATTGWIPRAPETPSPGLAPSAGPQPRAAPGNAP